jgi:hypothetical protein
VDNDAVDAHLKRIEREAGVAGLADALTGLAPTDLQSLLLHVFSTQAARREPKTLLQRYERDGTLAPGKPAHVLEALARAASRSLSGGGRSRR